MTNCPQCNRETTNPKFCSSSCAAKYNNVHFPKRKKEGSCLTCSTGIPRKHKYCEECRPGKTVPLTTTLGELQSLRSYQKSSRVRNLARPFYLKNTSHNCCLRCGYSKHVEICHIKAINSYPETATLAEINSLENLISLCPNCHWELDHGQIDSTEVEELLEKRKTTGLT